MWLSLWDSCNIDRAIIHAALGWFNTARTEMLVPTMLLSSTCSGMLSPGAGAPPAKDWPCGEAGQLLDRFCGSTCFMNIPCWTRSVIMIFTKHFCDFLGVRSWSAFSQELCFHSTLNRRRMCGWRAEVQKRETQYSGKSQAAQNIMAWFSRDYFNLQNLK